MKKNKIALLSIFAVGGITLAVGSTFAKWAVTDNAEKVNVNVSVGEVAKHLVKYHTVNANGTAYILLGSEEVYDGETVSNIPTITQDINNHKFDKWFTSDALSVEFDANTPVTADINVYAGFIGYYAKGNNESTYHLMSRNGGSITQYVSKQEETFNYDYFLDETSMNGHTLNIYSHYLTKSTYTSIANTKFLNGNTSTNFVSKYRVYFNENDKAISLTKRFYVEIKDTTDHPFFHLWGSDNNYETEYPGLGTTYLKIVDNYKRYYFLDIDTSKYNNYKLTTRNNNDQNQVSEQGDKTFSADSNNCYWCERNLSDGGWYTYSE